MKPIDLERKRDLGRILDDAFALYRANWRTLLTVSTAVVVPVLLLVYGVGFGWLTGGYNDVASGEEVRLSDVAPALSGVLAQLLVVTPLVTAMTVHVVRASAAGERLSPGAAIRAGLDDFSALLPALVLMFAGLVLGFMALVVPGVILAVRWAVVAQVVVIEGRHGTQALGRSFELTRGFGWPTFFVVLTLAVLAGVVSAVLQIPLDEAGKSADTMLLPLAGEIVGTILVLPVVATAYTLLYYSLLVQQGEVRPAAERPAFEPPASGPEPLTSEPEPPAAEPEPPASEPRTLPGVPGTYGDGWAPPRPPG